MLTAVALAGALFIPGYYSHDELQWLARADVGSFRDLPWVAWSRTDAFQYRPLTFNLWLLFAHAAGYSAWKGHSLHVFLAGVDCLLVRASARSFGASGRTAAWCMAAFATGAYAMFTHAWIATLADLLWLASVATCVLWLRRSPETPDWRTIVADVAATLLLALAALCSKEAAIVFPLLVAGAALGHPQPRRVVHAVVAGALCVLLYLWLRLDTILFVPRDPGNYTWHVLNVPKNVIEYLLYPWMPTRLEVLSVLHRFNLQFYLGATCAVLVVGAVVSAGTSWLLALVAGIFTALGPVLILDIGSTQYGYVAWAVGCLIIALAFPRMRRWARRTMIALFVASSLHGAVVLAKMIQVGRVQQHLYASLMPRLKQLPSNRVLTIAPQRPGDIWMPERLLYRIPGYRGQSIGSRVRVTRSLKTADLLMRHDGVLIGAQGPAH